MIICSSLRLVKMTTSTKKKTSLPVAQNPLILRCHRLMEAFAKSDDERDFYLDRVEGFIIYVDLDHSKEELDALHEELEQQPDRYRLIPKLTFFETKKIMEGFVNEKVYDIDTKEKLLDIIQSKEAREHFLEFIYDHHTELEKWQQYYQERSRIRIIEWLRKNEFYFVFEEDLDFTKQTMENIKKSLFDKEVGRDVQNARKTITAKAKTYYSNEALNPRPKRGRPPKQTAKLEIEPQVSVDIYTQVSPSVRPFLFTPDITSSSAAIFSSKFDSEAELLASRRISQDIDRDVTLESLNKKLATLRDLSSKFVDKGITAPLNGYEGSKPRSSHKEVVFEDFDEDNFEEFEEEDEDMSDQPVKPATKKSTAHHAAAKPAAKKAAVKKAPAKKAAAVKKAPAKKAPAKKPVAAAKKPAVKKAVVKKAPAKKTAAVKKAPAKKAPAKKAVVKKAPAKKTTAAKKAPAKKAAPKAKKH